ncbi:MAG: TlpA disulfide reductase family protein [Eubacteriales bacterium]|nr:TlpA disulfide reductase family protein [Eubacteriales bacterium]
MKKLKRFAALFLSIALAFSLAACAGAKDQPDDAGEFTEGTKLGDFTTQDISGNDVDQSIFAGRRLTLVNVMATWCTPCVEEFPALEQLRRELEEEGVGVVAFVTDTRGEDSVDADALDSAKTLAERTEVQFPLLVPDETLLGGKLNSVTAFPTSFFVDETGTIVGDAFSGAYTAGEWADLAREQLEKLED